MIADAIKDCSGRGDIVLDLFGGSGSTLLDQALSAPVTINEGGGAKVVEQRPRCSRRW